MKREGSKSMKTPYQIDEIIYQHNLSKYPQYKFQLVSTCSNYVVTSNRYFVHVEIFQVPELKFD